MRFTAVVSLSLLSAAGIDDQYVGSRHHAAGYVVTYAEGVQNVMTRNIAAADTVARTIPATSLPADNAHSSSVQTSNCVSQEADGVLHDAAFGKLLR